MAELLLKHLSWAVAELRSSGATASPFRDQDASPCLPC
eukprot:CAMPEP_0119540814 /NCGR_PEP_ID=MMETSP1344-20130328/52571_1 /TAXON_ID=236787 /ORGANISM="Florenciella parvula, Strain CCMP2471" /LENGTH=37 /DNA_ID= /DNA_START= /DNA_END= /DNA_ORIENTATION=